jgi:predicted RNA-binding Zn-ribbon protein involved in translation (DUF1610 family)
MAITKQTQALLYPPLRVRCHGREGFTLEEAMERAVVSFRCPECGWFHLLRPIQRPERERELQTR